MSNEEKVEKIGSMTDKGVRKVVDTTDIPETRVEPNKEKFDASMRINDATLQVNKNEAASKSTLIDEIRNLNTKVDNTTRATPIELAGKSQEVIAQIEELKNRLNNPQIEIKNDYKQILRNKLEFINDNLKVALDKAGLEYTPPESVNLGNGGTPVERFLDLLTNGQEQLKTLGGELQTISANNATISPANLMMVQIKVNYAQQEIELFTSLLNKALESVKTIMNVQV